MGELCERIYQTFCPAVRAIQQYNTQKAADSHKKLKSDQRKKRINTDFRSPSSCWANPPPPFPFPIFFNRSFRPSLPFRIFFLLQALYISSFVTYVKGEDDDNVDTVEKEAGWLELTRVVSIISLTRT